jgi:AI-2 transport protein TqsA
MQLEQRVQTVCLLVLTAIATGWVLHWLRPVMIPFVLAVFLAIALGPVVDAQVRYFKAPRGLAILATMMMVFLLLNVIAGLVSASVKQLAAQIPVYQSQLARLLNDLSASVAFEWLGLDREAATKPLLQMATENTRAMLLTATNALLAIVSQGLLVMVFLLFLLLAGGSGAESGRGVLGEVEANIRRYLLLKTLISATTGAIVWVVLMLLGVDLAFVFGFFTFVLNYIPSIGSVIATLLPLPIVLVSPDITTAGAVMAIMIPFAIHFVIGNFIDPKVMGDSLDLHPVTVLLSLMVWGTIWGVVGMLLAVPLTASIKMVMQRAELMSPVADVLAGRLHRFRR